MATLRAILACCLFEIILVGSAQVCLAQDNEAVLLSYIGVWNTGELDRLDGLVTSDFQRHAGPSETCDSMAALKQVISTVRSTFDRLEIRIDDYMTESDQGALRGEFYGVHRDVNRVVKFPIMSMFRFREGRVAEEWILGNNFMTLVGLGYELVPPGFKVIDAAEREEERRDSPVEDVLRR